MQHPASTAIERVKTASATLARATGFLAGGHLLGAPSRRPIEGASRTKVIGNGLRELDRFLSLLIDEVALALALPDLDHADFARRRNTANKLWTLRTAMAGAIDDAAGLRGIGRSRDTLFHCAGIVRRGDDRSSDRMTLGWPASPGPRSVRLGEALAFTSADLRRICAFYDRIAGELVHACS